MPDEQELYCIVVNILKNGAIISCDTKRKKSHKSSREHFGMESRIARVGLEPLELLSKLLLDASRKKAGTFKKILSVDQLHSIRMPIPSGTIAHP